jgi:CRISPR/Cas system endoribonuclease Cas6 (RAMP superfamily)
MKKTISKFDNFAEKFVEWFLDFDDEKFMEKLEKGIHLRTPQLKLK